MNRRLAAAAVTGSALLASLATGCGGGSKGNAGKPTGEPPATLPIAAAALDPKPVDPPKPKEVEWTDASKGGVQVGDVKVWVDGVMLEKPKEIKQKDDTLSGIRTMAVIILAKNTSQSRMDLEVWASDAELIEKLTGKKTNGGNGHSLKGFEIRDEKENVYRPLLKGLVTVNGKKIGDSTTKVVVMNVGDVVEMYVVFESPPDSAEQLKLTMPGKPFGVGESYHFIVPNKSQMFDHSTN